MATGKRMAEARAYVERHGETGFHTLAHYVSPSYPTKCESYGYDTVWRAIKAGLLEYVPRRKGSGVAGATVRIPQSEGKP